MHDPHISYIFIYHLMYPKIDFLCGSHFIQRAVASTNTRITVRFADLKQRRYWLPLMVFLIYYLESLVSEIHLLYGVELRNKLAMTIRA